MLHTLMKAVVSSFGKSLLGVPRGAGTLLSIIAVRSSRRRHLPAFGGGNLISSAAARASFSLRAPPVLPPFVPDLEPPPPPLRSGMFAGVTTITESLSSSDATSVPLKGSLRVVSRAGLVAQ